MKNFVNKILQKDIVTLLVVTAIGIFAVQILSMLPNLIRVFPTRPGTALAGAILTTVSALIQPCLLLGVAKIISLIQSRV
jgi:hypothetical protein